MRILLILLIMIISKISLGSAWVKQKDKYKIIAKLDNNNMQYLSKNNDIYFLKTKSLISSLEFEYGLSKNYSLGYFFDYEKIYNYDYLYLNDQSKIARVYHNKSHIKQFTHGISLKRILYEKDLFVFSAHTDLSRTSGGLYDLQPGLMFGRSFNMLNKWHFIEAKISYLKALNNYSDILKTKLAIGIHNKKNILYLSEIFLYKQHHIYDMATRRMNKNISKYKDIKLQFSRIKKFNKDISLQIGLYSNIYKMKKNRNFGTILSLWYEP